MGMNPYAAIWGSAIQAASTRAARMSDKHMYERQWDREYAMANSAHQREIADLRAAGLNPILSAGGKGAPTASVGAPSDPGFGFDGVSTAKAIEEIKLLNAQARKENAIANTTGKVLNFTDTGLDTINNVKTFLTDHAGEAGGWLADKVHKIKNYLSGSKVDNNSAKNAPLGQTENKRKSRSITGRRH